MILLFRSGGSFGAVGHRVPFCDGVALRVLVVEWLAQDASEPIHGTVGSDPEGASIILWGSEDWGSRQKHLKLEEGLVVGVGPMRGEGGFLEGLAMQVAVVPVSA